jgi:aldose 1-epimerase
MALETVTIRDEATGASAQVLPALGFNCFSFRIPAASGPLEALWSAPDFARGAAKPSGSGIPLLFPFAGRIRGAAFAYQGKRYALDAGDGLGNAIHGFVIGRPWRVIERGADRVSGRFQASVDDPALLEKWPADFCITAEYRLSGKTLVGEYLIENPDKKPLPFGFGTHGYFRVPLGGPSAADCLVTVPVSTNWELDHLLPTGKQTSPAVVSEISRGMPTSAMQLDNVFGGLKFENHRATTSVRDPRGNHQLTMTFDDQFTACVVFNPPHREAVCIEPYTTLPDAFALGEKGIDPSLRVLAPGASMRTRIDIRLD